MKTARARIGIIGGGIFGTTCALVLSRYFQVTVFERGRGILAGASYANQYRHHIGYHYPRSISTIKEIKNAASDFEEFYGATISSQFPSYYCINKTDSHTTTREFLKVCDTLHLPYSVEYPDPELLEKSTVGVCVKTPEAVYDYKRLKALIKSRMKESGVGIGVNRTVIGAAFGPAHTKILTVLHAGQEQQYVFDYVINATYSRYNDFCAWLRFPLRQLEFRLKELIVLQIAGKKRAAITVMDGPFATLVPIAGTKDRYTLGDVPLSIHQHTRSVTRASTYHTHQSRSRYREMLKRCSAWFPVLARARYIKSMFVVLPIDVSSGGTDARPTELTYHGSGCWSILSGKIITAVTTAQKILREIQAIQKARI